MKTKEIKELHTKSITELKALLIEAKNELFNLKMDLEQKKLNNLRAFWSKRKDIARILTVIKEKEVLNKV